MVKMLVPAKFVDDDVVLICAAIIGMHATTKTIRKTSNPIRVPNDAIPFFMLFFLLPQAVFIKRRCEEKSKRVTKKRAVHSRTLARERVPVFFPQVLLKLLAVKLIGRWLINVNGSLKTIN